MYWLPLYEQNILENGITQQSEKKSPNTTQSANLHNTLLFHFRSAAFEIP